MRTMFILFAMVCINIPLLASSGGKQEIKGRVIEKNTGEPLSGVTVITTNPKLAIGTITDENGEFRLWDIPSDLQGLKISLTGYKTSVVENPLESIKEGFPMIIEMENKIEIKKKFFGIFLSKSEKSEMNTSLAIGK